jgi:hypothetical protein
MGGHYTSDGGYVAGKTQMAQMDKNRVRRRAQLSEHAMRRIRSVIDNPHNESNTQIVEAVVDALEDWESALEQFGTCDSENDGVRCKLPVGHKHRHVGIDGFNHRSHWPASLPAALDQEATNA